MAEYLSSRTELTLNREYAAAHLGIGPNLSYTQTIFNEITLLPRESVIEIDIKTRKLTLKKVRVTPDRSIALNSREGMRLLDAWQQKWCSIYRAIKDKSNNITVQLSGGFDSRLNLAFVLCSKININDIVIQTYGDTLWTHKEDYEIACEIASSFGLKLNKPVAQESRPLKLKQVLDTQLFKIFEHKQMYFRSQRYNTAHFLFGGFGGEVLRDYWVMSPKEFIAQNKVGAFNRSTTLVRDATKFMRDNIKQITKIYHFSDLEDPYIPVQLYTETRTRNHFGYDTIGRFLSNVLMLAPQLDIVPRKLKLTDEVCNDPNLLPAIIFKRYCPELLNFKFDSGRSIDPKTLAYAESISGKYHVAQTAPETYHLKIQEIIADEDNFASEPISKEEANAYLKSIFLTDDVKKLFCMYFDEEIYDKAKADCEVRSFYPLTNVYPIIGIAMAAAYCMRWKLNPHHGTCGILDSFNPRTQQNTNPYALPIRDDLITARIDIRNIGNEKNDVEVFDMSDEGAIEQAPQFMKKSDGSGRMVYSAAGNLSMHVRCIGNGTLNVALRSRDIRDKEGTKLPRWIFYRKFKINGDVVFDSIHPTWENAYYTFRKEVKDREIITLQIEWISDAQTAIIKGNEVLNERRIQISALNTKLKDVNAAKAKLSTQLKDANAAKAKLGTQLKDANAANRDLEKVNKNLERQLTNIRSGMSFRIGRIITYIPRKILGKN